jgi:hypothetical protein
MDSRRATTSVIMDWDTIRTERSHLVVIERSIDYLDLRNLALTPSERSR